jgi:adenosylcobinamide-GDP ribazoletransferase
VNKRPPHYDTRDGPVAKAVLSKEGSACEDLTPIFFTPTIGRWSMVIAAFLGKPARLKDSMGKLFMDYISWREVIFASLTMVVIGIPLFRLYLIPLVIIDVVIVLLILKYSQKRIGGISGDILGAINEIVEVFILLTLYIFGIK